MTQHLKDCEAWTGSGCRCGDLGRVALAEERARRRKRTQRREAAKTIGALLFVVLFFAILVLGAWARFAAPCRYLTWMPVKEVPSRCLTFVRDN